MIDTIKLNMTYFIERVNHSNYPHVPQLHGPINILKITSDAEPIMTQSKAPSYPYSVSSESF